MRKGLGWYLLPVLLGLGFVCAPPARAQAPGSLSEPQFQSLIERMDLRAYTPRLNAMGGALIATDDPNNLVNSWRLDRNPAALIEDVQGNTAELMGRGAAPRRRLVAPDGFEYRPGDGTERFLGLLGRARFRNRAAGLVQISYRSLVQENVTGPGAYLRDQGNGPRLELAVNQRTGKFYYGLGFSAYNVDESGQVKYDTTAFDSLGLLRLQNQPEIKTDRVSYHSLLETVGVQYEVMDGLHIGGTIGIEQQRVDAASSNQRMQLDALNNRNPIRESLDAIYRNRDRVIVAARWFHNSYNSSETFRFSRRKLQAVQDPPVTYDGHVADHYYRTWSFDTRALYRLLDRRQLQLGLVYTTGKDELGRVVAAGPGSYNYFDSLFLNNTAAAESLGVSPGPLVGQAFTLNKYIQWGAGAQYHPNLKSTVTAEFSRYTSDLTLNDEGRSPERKTYRAGGEYLVQPKLAVRAGYALIRDNADRNKLIDKTRNHQISFGLGYAPSPRRDLELVYLTGNTKSDFPDPSQREVRERGLHLYARVLF